MGRELIPFRHIACLSLKTLLELNTLQVFLCNYYINVGSLLTIH